MANKVWFDAKGVKDAVMEAQIEPIQKAALLVEREAKTSMKRGGRTPGKKTGTPSTAGEPPNVQTGNLRASIQISVTKRGTYLVGPTRQAWYGRLHEFGGKRGRRHPKRPFMRPALWNTKDKFPRLWRNLKLAKTRSGIRMNTRKVS